MCVLRMVDNLKTRLGHFAVSLLNHYGKKNWVYNHLRQPTTLVCVSYIILAYLKLLVCFTLIYLERLTYLKLNQVYMTFVIYLVPNTWVVEVREQKSTLFPHVRYSYNNRYVHTDTFHDRRHMYKCTGFMSNFIRVGITTDCNRSICLVFLISQIPAGINSRIK